MRMYKCDRCGNLVSKSNLKALSKPTVFRFGKKKHLCKRCTSSFFEWFEQGRKDANN